MKKFLSLVLTLAVVISSMSLMACKTEQPAADVFYNVTRSAENGTITSTTDQAEGKVAYGGKFTVSYTPNSGYVFSDLLINGKSVKVGDDDFKDTYTQYTIENVIKDYNVVAKFVKADATIKYLVGEGGEPIADGTAKTFKAIGELPTAYALGKKFVKWVDNVSGEEITPQTIVGSQTMVLRAEYVNLTEDEIAQLVPFTATVGFYDQTSAKLGVVWHNAMEPVNPKIEVATGEQTDANGFTSAKYYPCTYEKWVNNAENTYHPYAPEYLVYSVIDDLTPGAKYSVRFGDGSANKWSEIYTFTAKNPEADEAKFIYITDTQEKNHPEDGGIDSVYMKYVMQAATDKFMDNGIDFVVHGGDYLDHGEIPVSYANEMLSSMNQWLFDLPVLPTSGNHEDPKVGVTHGMVNVLGKLYNIKQPDEVQYQTRGLTYSFDYGPAHFIVMRSNDIFYRDGDAGVREDARLEYGYLTVNQMNWIKSDLAEAKADPNVKFIVGVMHEGPLRGNKNIAFNPAKRDSGNNTVSLCEQLVPVLYNNGVDLVLFGHDHYFYSSMPVVIDDSITAVSQPTQYSHYRKVVPDPNVVKASTEYLGETIDTFYAKNDGKQHGVMFYQIGAGGNQTGYHNEVITNLTDHLGNPYYRIDAIGGKDTKYANYNASMYSYITISSSELKVMTYGVDAMAIYQGGSLADNNKFFDGFAIYK